MKEEMWWLTLQRKRTVRGHCRQRYASGFNYKWQVDKCSEKNKHTKTDSKGNRMYRNRIILHKINWIFNPKPSTNKWTNISRTRWFDWEFYLENKMSILHIFFQNIKEDRIFPNSFYEVSINQVPKPDKNITRKKNTFRPSILLMSIDENKHKKKTSIKY